MRRLAHFFMWVMIILVVLLSILNLVLIVRINEQQNDKLIQQSSDMADAEKRINQHIDQVQNYIGTLKPKDGYTPKKGVDYFDGKNGSDGNNATDEQIQNAVNTFMQSHPLPSGADGKEGSDGTNGFTPTIRCNTFRNRWEVKYSDTGAWKLLNNESVKCTIDQ